MKNAIVGALMFTRSGREARFINEVAAGADPQSPAVPLFSSLLLKSAMTKTMNGVNSLIYTWG